jgi:pimeloyl-ACP methyl ester carboxylesterase
LEVLVRALGLVSMTLVGHSLGAITAARFTRRNPAMVSRLILASPAGGHARLPQEERIKLREGRLNDLRTLGPKGLAEKRGPGLLSQHASAEQRDAVVRVMAQVHPAGYEQAVRLLGSSDTTADLEALPAAMPVEFVYGELDRVTTPESILRIAAVRPSAKVHVIPRAGHAVYVESADAFNQVVLNKP